MNETMRQLMERKSVRVFTDRNIEEEIVQEILRAAVMAPTAGNQQLYTILRITDPELLEQLAESCDHQPFIAKGRLVLLFCADCRKWYEAFRITGCGPRHPGAGDLLIAVDDALIAAQNAVVAALLVFGYPTKQQEERKKPERFAMEHIVFNNRYPDMGSEDLMEMMRIKSGKEDPVSWLQAFCKRKYNSGFAREMTRSVERYLEQFRTPDPADDRS